MNFRLAYFFLHVLGNDIAINTNKLLREYITFLNIFFTTEGSTLPA
jgi:hypothetical protein